MRKTARIVASAAMLSSIAVFTASSDAMAQTYDNCDLNSNACLFAQNSGTGSGSYGVSAGTTNGTAVFATDIGSGNGVWATSNSGPGVKGVSTSGDGVQGTSSTGYSGNFTKGSGKLDAGIYYSNGNCFQNCTSDIRLKKNVEPLAGALDTLLQLRGVTFDWKNPEQQGEKQRGRQRGFIAQEVEKTFPEWIGEDSNGFKTIAMTPTQITALEVESIRTLKTQNDLLTRRVAQLESDRQHVGFTMNGIGLLGGGGLVVGALLVASKRRRDEKREEAQ